MEVFRKILLVGSFQKGALENSYVNAFNQNNCLVDKFDTNLLQKKYIRLGKFGQLLNKFIPVEPWIRKCNRELFIKVIEYEPDLILVFGQSRVMTGTIAQIKTSTTSKIAFIWQDSLVFLNPTLINSLLLYDTIFTYSSKSVEIIKKLGAINVFWLPLGADEAYHRIVPPRNEFISDLTFIGQWRPERENAIKLLLERIPDLNIKIWGLDWNRFSTNNKIRESWQGKSLFGSDFSSAVASAKLNLNVIDDTNYPAANMRFFEIPCSGGVQLCSSCPEMEFEFKNKQSILYFNNEEELINIITEVISNKIDLDLIRTTSNELVIKNHTYKHRALEILINCFS